MLLEEGLSSLENNILQLDESYICRFFCDAKEIFKDPSDFRLNEFVNLPLTHLDVQFKYTDIETDRNIIYGEIRTNWLNPINHDVSVNGTIVRILNYGNISIENGVKVLRVNVELINGSLMVSRSDTSKENIVLDKMTHILRLNNDLKNILSKYQYDWLEYTYENINRHEENNHILKIINSKYFDDNEIRYKLNDIKSTLDYYEGDLILSGLKDRLWEMVNRFTARKIISKYYGKLYTFNIHSFISWILNDLSINHEMLKLKSLNDKDIDVNISKEGNDYTLTFKPNNELFYYVITLEDVVKVVLDETYWEYNITRFSFQKVSDYYENPEHDFGVEIGNVTLSTDEPLTTYWFKPIYDTEEIVEDIDLSEFNNNEKLVKAILTIIDDN